MSRKINTKAYAAKYMPDSFVQRCPVCKGNWNHNVVGDKVEVLCLTCYNKDTKTNMPGWIWKCAARAEPVSDEDIYEAYIELWWTMCYCFGVVRAIGLSEGKEN